MFNITPIYNNYGEFVMQVILKHDGFHRKYHVVQDKQNWIDGVVILTNLVANTNFSK